MTSVGRLQVPAELSKRGSCAYEHRPPGVDQGCRGNNHAQRCYDLSRTDSGHVSHLLVPKRPTRALSTELHYPYNGASSNGAACLRTIHVPVRNHSVTWVEVKDDASIFTDRMHTLPLPRCARRSARAKIPSGHRTFYSNRFIPLTNHKEEPRSGSEWTRYTCVVNISNIPS